MPGTADKEGDIHTAESVIDGNYEERISGKEESCQSQGGILRQGYFIRRTVQFQKGGSADQPFGHGGPEMDLFITVLRRNKLCQTRPPEIQLTNTIDTNFVVVYGP
jgi:hypothetical protein